MPLGASGSVQCRSVHVSVVKKARLIIITSLLKIEWLVLDNKLEI